MSEVRSVNGRVRHYPKHRGTVKEVADYIASQEAANWPGSKSIHGREIATLRWRN